MQKITGSHFPAEPLTAHVHTGNGDYGIRPWPEEGET